MTEQFTWRGFDSSYDSLINQITGTNKAECLVAAGYKVYTQCGWTGVERPGPRVLNLRAADEAGLLISLYISLPDNCQNGIVHISNGLAGIPDELLRKLCFVAVDVERPGIHAVAIRDAVNTLRAMGYTPIIYTSLNAWQNYVVFDATNTPTSFTDVMLWNAFWDNDPDLDFHSHPYGLWAGIVGEQYTGDAPECGQELDHSIWNTTLFPGGTQTMPTEPTSQQSAAAAGYLLGIAVKLAQGGTLSDTDKALLRFFGS